MSQEGVAVLLVEAHEGIPEIFWPFGQSGLPGLCRIAIALAEAKSASPGKGGVRLSLASICRHVSAE